MSQKPLIVFVTVASLKRGDVIQVDGPPAEVMALRKNDSGSGWLVSVRRQAASSTNFDDLRFKEDDTVRRIAPGTIFTRWWTTTHRRTFIPSVKL